MDTLTQLRNRLPASTVLLVGSGLCSFLMLFGVLALLFGSQGRSSWVGWTGNPLLYLAGMVALPGGVILFGWLLAPGWRGQFSAVGGFLAAGLALVLGVVDLVYLMVPHYAASSVWTAMLGNITAATALLLSRAKSWYAITGVAVGFGASTALAYASALTNGDRQGWAYCVFGWMSAIFFWSAFAKQFKWWDAIVWLGIMAALFIIAR